MNPESTPSAFRGLGNNGTAFNGNPTMSTSAFTPGGFTNTGVTAPPAFRSSGSAFGPWSQPTFPGTTRSEQGSQQTSEPVHTGISCGFCGKSNIRGVRYKCIQCPSHDRCAACMGSPKAWASHHLDHQFFPIFAQGDLTDFNALKLSSSHWSQRKAIHHGGTCDGCNRADMEGVRHRCLQCEDFDFCEQCVADPKQREAHNLSHPFFPLVSPLDRSAYDRVRAQLLAQNASPNGPAHVGISCDLCGQNPLVGVRHKCFDCPGELRLHDRWA
ncbi:hypothetical protein C8Q76DRAFT_749500 [Earliella scabrosa]|nr:hypothetical protein C8Q76DRAFT_749500 [Earliella scabrosa]